MKAAKQEQNVKSWLQLTPGTQELRKGRRKEEGRKELELCPKRRPWKWKGKEREAGLRPKESGTRRSGEARAGLGTPGKPKLYYEDPG